MKRIFQSVAMALCLVGGAHSVQNVSPIQSSAIQEAPPISTEVERGKLYAGPDARSQYTLEELKALQKQAGVPLMVLGLGDVASLSAPNNPLQSVKEIRSMVPPQFSVTESDVQIIYQALVNQRPRANALYQEISDGKKELMGGIILVPGSVFSEDYYRPYSVNFPKGTLSKELLREGSLFSAAHEASHIKLARYINHSEASAMSEAGAEMGAYDFLDKNPSLFPNLKDPALAQAMLQGRRALAVLIDHTGIGVGHGAIPFCSPKAMNCSSPAQFDQYSETVENAAHDLILTVAQQMYKSQLLPPITDAEAFEAAVGRITDYKKFTPISQGNAVTATGVKIDYTSETAPLLKKYLGKKGVRNSQSEAAITAIQVFSDNLGPLFGGVQGDKKKAKIFMNHWGIKQYELRRMVEAGKIYAAKKKLRDSFEVSMTDKVQFGPEVTMAVPASNGLLRDALRTVRTLRGQGAFKNSLEQTTFVDNLLAGADFYVKDWRAEPNPTIKINSSIKLAQLGF